MFVGVEFYKVVFSLFQSPPNIPQYMKRIQRVYRGVLSADELLVDKTVRECLRKGFYDGRYQGYVQGRSPFHAPMVPISSLWYDDPRARDFSVHHYRLGFWYGQLRTLPAGHMPPASDTDLAPHQEIARVSSTYLHYVQGLRRGNGGFYGMSFLGRCWTAVSASDFSLARVVRSAPITLRPCHGGLCTVSFPTLLPAPQKGSRVPST